MLRDFCEREGEAVSYRKGDQLEREGDPARWFAFVESGCFKYVNHGNERLRVGDRRSGIDKEHITWFSFAGEFVVDYPTFLYDRPSQTTIVAMMPSRIFRVTGEQLRQFFSQSVETMQLRATIARASWSTSTCRTSPRSLTSPPRPSARFVKRLLSAKIRRKFNKNS